jgi:hypothetical protein
MPILLTTPFDPGAFDPGNTYPRAKIVQYVHNVGDRMTVTMELGDVDGEGQWERGLEAKAFSFSIWGLAYDSMMENAVPEEGETIYEASKRVLYEYVIANYPQFAGTIE